MSSPLSESTVFDDKSYLSFIKYFMGILSFTDDMFPGNVYRYLVSRRKLITEKVCILENWKIFL